MIYRDVLYGAWELPEVITKISQTKEMVRLRGITQSVVPNEIMPLGSIPSRFHHGLGVAYLAIKVLECNATLADYRILLPVAALLHDAGNPPFAHLSEPFLRELTGYDGESFLKEILDGSATANIIQSYGLRTDEVIHFVTGNAKPISDVLNGSLDIDNLDNIARYNYAIHCNAAEYDGVRIASSFRFENGAWHLLDECFAETERWQQARAEVYASVYGAGHLCVAMMMYRAVELAFLAGDLIKDFFFLDDAKAVSYLRECCNTQTQTLVNRAWHWDWYEEIFDCAATIPSKQIRLLAETWQGRYRLASAICNACHIAPEQICVYIGKGRDRRRITMPFINTYGSKRLNMSDDSPLYRVKVFVAPELRDQKTNIVHCIKHELE